MKKTAILIMTGIMILTSCEGKPEKKDNNADFAYTVDTFADLEILRYKVPGFENLSLQQKELIFHLSEAAHEGRDILYDQNNKYNLAIRRTLEAIYKNYKGDRKRDEFQELELYLKRVWFSNGIHHHYGQDKFKPGFSKNFFVRCVEALPSDKFPTMEGQNEKQFLDMILPIIFDPKVMAKKINQTEGDLLLSSANNYYGENVNQKEAQEFYRKMRRSNDSTPVAYGLNSRLVKENGKLVEKVWKENGLYTEAITKIIEHLKKAEALAENAQQKKVISELIRYYNTGDLKYYDDYSVAWVNDQDSRVDFVNGFTEVYGDPLGIKASWESMVHFTDLEASKRTQIISENADWFEQNSPIDDRFKKENVKGVTAKVITVVQIGGDCYPSTPIGVNLPNSNWIRKDHGSKSVTIENIMKAYDAAGAGSGFSKEFAWSDEEKTMMKEFGLITDLLHTDLHECLGHASGKMLDGVDDNAMGELHSTIEETRADLFALYYLADPKLVKLGIIPNAEAYKAEYYKYMMNGLMTQLVRIEVGGNIEEDHMRNRQLIARWVFEKGQADKTVELITKNEKTFVVVNDYEKLRSLFGELLTEIQRVKSEGDYTAAKKLVNNYAIRVDRELHNEILTRYAALNMKPYKGFVNPILKLVKDSKGNTIDVDISYIEGYAEQMMRLSRQYSPLPTYN